MPKFIKVHSVNTGREIILNIDSIVTLCNMDSMTVINVSDDRYIEAEERFEDIENLINEQSDSTGKKFSKDMQEECDAESSTTADNTEPYAPSQIYEFIVEGSGIDYSIYQIKAKSMKDALIKYCKYDECLKNAEFKAVEKLDVSDALDLVNNALYSEIVEIHTMDVELFNNEKNYITRICDEE